MFQKVPSYTHTQASEQKSLKAKACNGGQRLWHRWLEHRKVAGFSTVPKPDSPKPELSLNPKAKAPSPPGQAGC